MANDRHDPRRIEVVDDRVAAILRTKTPAERLRMTFEMNRSIRRMLANVIRGEHRDWTDQQIVAEVARRMGRGTG